MNKKKDLIGKKIVYSIPITPSLYIIGENQIKVT